MRKGPILSEVTEIFRNVLDNPDVLLHLDTVASDIEEWDSLNHIQLIVAVEKHFKIRFTSLEIHSFQNVGQMCDKISAKLKNEHR